MQALPVDCLEMAYEFKAFARARKIRSPMQLLQVVMLYCGLDLSLRSCAGEIAQLQGYLSDTAVKKRLSACVPWVKAMLAGMFDLEALVDNGSLRFIVIDGSTVQEPGATATSYRLHIAIDLINLTLQQVEVTSDKQGENLGHYTLESGDVVLIDRGYNEPKSLVPFLDQGGDVVLRYNAHSMKLYQEKEEENEQKQMVKIDWQSYLSGLPRQPMMVPAYLCHADKRIEVFVHLIPLPEQKACEARRKARLKAKKKGRSLNALTRLLCGWTLILTSVPPQILDTQTVAALYRARWQVELLIKRLKSLLKIDELRARKDSQLAELYLHGKLLYAAVIEKLMRKRFAYAATKMDAPRELTHWRLCRSVAEEIDSGLKACFTMQTRHIQDCIKSMTERPRRRKLQSLPESVIQLIEICRQRGLSRV